MNSLNRFARAAGLIAAGAALAACVSLLPKSKPVKLYRFEGRPAASAPAAAPAVERFGVYKAPGTFVRSAAGDRILTLNGDRAAYVAEARWMAPASVLFDEALLRAFDANTGPARLASRGESARTDYVLRLDVREFNAVYDRGSQAAPEIVVRLRAVLTRNTDRAVAGEQLIEARARAEDNRVTAISAAFDQAVGEALGRLVDFTNRRGAPAP